MQKQIRIDQDRWKMCRNMSKTRKVGDKYVKIYLPKFSAIKFSGSAAGGGRRRVCGRVATGR